MLPLHVARSFPFLLLSLGLTGGLAHHHGWLDFHQDSPPAPRKPPELEVRALANEGFLLSFEDDVVAIDAFVA